MGSRENTPTTSGVCLSKYNKFSCNECKRRRVKCSRQAPICELCSKYNRDCIYENQRRTPLTRKHLTDVENKLNLANQLLRKYIPDIDLSSLSRKMENRSSINDIPELSQYINQSNKTRDLGYNNNNNDYMNRHESNQRGLTEDLNTSDSLNLAVSQNKTIINIQSLLDEDPIEDSNKAGAHVFHPKEGIQDSNNTIGKNTIFQIPQLLPSSINLDAESKLRHDQFERKKFDKPINLKSTSKYLNHNWDERHQSDGNVQPSIIDGKATTVESGYLGTAFSMAVVNLVGDGFFFHETGLRRKELTASLHDSSFSKESISKQKLEYYIDQYFETYHISYPIVHKPTFMAQFNKIILPLDTGWESLLYIIAAIGSFMSATSQEESDDLSLFDIAKTKLSIEVLETGNITLVQTLTLMSNYLQKRDRPNSGYNYLGLAVRMALGLGLHKQIDDSDTSLLNQEIRRRIWWCLYIFDCGQTIGYGRPLGIPCAGISASLPLNILDSNLTALSAKLPDEEDAPTICTSVRLQSLFHMLTNSIYERIITDPFPSALLLLEWDQQYLERWKRLIPNYFKKEANVPKKFMLAHSVLEWRYRNLKIIMFRTFLLKKVLLNSKVTNDNYDDVYELRAGELCIEECSLTIDSMSRFWQQVTEVNRMQVWYTLYFLIPALLMPLVCLRNDPSSSQSERWRVDIISAQNIIRSVLKVCPAASKILDLIESLGTGYLRTDVDNNGPPTAYSMSGTDESPLAQLNQLHLLLWPVSFDIDQQFLK